MLRFVIWFTETCYDRKKFNIAVAVVCSLLGLGAVCFQVGCSSPTTTAPKAKSQTLKTEPAQAPIVKSTAPEEPAYCTANVGSKDYLKLLDTDLLALEQDKDPCGSFTDWFVINLWEGSKSGLPKAALKARVDKLILLANQGKFLSSYERALYEKGKSAAIRQYVEEASGIK